MDNLRLMFGYNYPITICYECEVQMDPADVHDYYIHTYCETCCPQCNEEEF